MAEDRSAAQDQHYVMFRGEWRRVPYIVQRAWERVVPKLFGGCATSTIYADGRWVGELAAEAWKREHRG